MQPTQVDENIPFVVFLFLIFELAYPFQPYNICVGGWISLICVVKVKKIILEGFFLSIGHAFFGEKLRFLIPFSQMWVLFGNLPPLFLV